MRAEALESLFCDLQDLTVLVGLGLNTLLSWWWADPVSALVLVPLFVKEGLENLSGDEEGHEDPEGVSAFATVVAMDCLPVGQLAVGRSRVMAGKPPPQKAMEKTPFIASFSSAPPSRTYHHWTRPSIPIHLIQGMIAEAVPRDVAMRTGTVGRMPKAS